jgi:hypothetical protein
MFFGLPFISALIYKDPSLTKFFKGRNEKYFSRSLKPKRTSDLNPNRGAYIIRQPLAAR